MRPELSDWAMAATVLRVGGDENPRIDGVKRYGDEISTALGSVLFAGKGQRDPRPWLVPMQPQPR
jgi:hypothetical protein